MDFIEKQAFRGIRALYGEPAFSRLTGAHAMVIGVGGIGSWCAECLCRSAVGELTLIDSDTIEISNLNRQSHTTAHTCGQLKVEVLGRRLQEINPRLKLHARSVLLTVDNIAGEMADSPQYVCECIDDLRAKAYVTDYLYRARKTFIVSGGAGGRFNPQALKAGDLSRACGNALLTRLRSLLRHEYGFPKGGGRMDIPCVFSSEKPVYSPKESFLSGDLPAFGASMAVTAASGLLMASWILRKIAFDN